MAGRGQRECVSAKNLQGEQGNIASIVCERVVITAATLPRACEPVGRAKELPLLL